MVGRSWGAPDPVGKEYPWSLTDVTTNTGLTIRQKRSVSTRVQILCPYPFSRHFQLAYGITYGSSRLAIRHADFDRLNNSLVPNTNVRTTTVRTRSLGVVVLRVTRLPGSLHDVTLLTGLSGEYNFSTQLKIRREDGQAYTLTSKDVHEYVHRYSLPAHVQFGWAPLQFWSVGGFFSYDLVPRFKGGVLNDIKGREMRQMVAGLSVGVVI